MNDYSSNYSSNFDNSSRRGLSSLSSKKLKRFFKRSAILPIAVVAVIVLIIGIFVVSNTANQTSAVSVPSISGDNRVTIEKPKAVQQLNKVYNYPLKDQTGKEVSKYTYEVQNAELRNELIVKGERATAVKGRTFVVLNIKITNNFNKSIQLNVKDYVRLSVNNSQEKLAPEIHSDPVDVQAISTKYTRVGFPINDTDKNLVLQIGEINGAKETIKLTVK